MHTKIPAMDVETYSEDVTTPAHVIELNLRAPGKLRVYSFGFGTPDPTGAGFAKFEAAAGPQDLIVAVHFVKPKDSLVTPSQRLIIDRKNVTKFG